MKTVFIFNNRARPGLRAAPAAVLALLLLLASAAAAHAEPAPAPGDELQRLAALVDYVAADYPGAVRDGRVLSPTEYTEQRGLLADARALAAHLAIAAAAPGTSDPRYRAVAADLDHLAGAVDRKEPADAVAALCRAVRTRLVTDLGLVLAPAAPPSLPRAESLFASGCARCHGADGRADTPDARRLEPRPVSFLDEARMSRISPALAFHALTFGVKDTAMPAFDTLPAADRWSLAFYVVALRHARADAEAGAAPLARATASVAPTTSRLAALSDAELDALLAPALPAAPDRARAIAHLRRDVSFATDPGGAFSAARRLVARIPDAPSIAAAHDLAVAAYLEGVEPHEAALRARDPALTTSIEAAFLDLRVAIDARAPRDELARKVLTIGLLLDRAEEHRAERGVAFAASLTIALREGLEAALLIGALLAFLRKSGRSSAAAARLVHVGWLTAIPAGVVTWWLAGALLAGARRELVEAVITLLAAAMILGVTHWVLGRMEARHWLGFLRRKVVAAAAPGDVEIREWALFGLAFFAAYREACEIILFYRALLLDAPGERAAIALGAVAGVGGIGLVLVIVQRLGRRLDARPVMLASSVLLSALAVTLVGRGVRALQEGGYVAVTPLHLPDLSSVGLYPTAQGLSAQAFVLLLVALPSLVERLRRIAAADAAAR